MSRITRWLAGAADPVRLAADLKMSPDPWQRKVLRSTAPRLHLNCSRQVGKSTVTAIAALHRALYVPASTVLVVSPSERQSAELFAKVGGFYQALGRPIDPLSENVHTLRLENDSRIISLPASESGIRGFTASLVLIDEAAYVPDSLYRSVSPMLAVSGGRLIAMSTPAGKRGWWFEASNSRQWDHIRVPATECPRISREFLDGERERLGEMAFAAEYLCSFADASGAAFRGDDVDAFLAGVAPPASARAEHNATAHPGTRAIQRHLRSVAGRKQAAERAVARRQASCDHRWHQEPPYACAWACGAYRHEEVTA